MDTRGVPTAAPTDGARSARFITTLYGHAKHWRALGSRVVWAPQREGFTVYITAHDATDTHTLRELHWSIAWVAATGTHSGSSGSTWAHDRKGSLSMAVQTWREFGAYDEAPSFVSAISAGASPEALPKDVARLAHPADNATRPALAQAAAFVGAGNVFPLLGHLQPSQTGFRVFLNDFNTFLDDGITVTCEEFCRPQPMAC